jgi:Adenine-specific methyltransferase EcoRI
VARSDLHTAQKAKSDEFYTQLEDIEKELKHYKNQLKGKVVFCNCDDPYESNFFKYFAGNFNYLGLKKLIATSYTKSPIAGKQLSLFDVEGLKPDGKQPFKIEINEVFDSDEDGTVGLGDVEYLLKHDKNTATPLHGNGDFRSEECIELLKEAI